MSFIVAQLISSSSILKVSLHPVKVVMKGVATISVPCKIQETLLKYPPKWTILSFQVSLKAELMVYTAQCKWKVKLLQLLPCYKVIM